MFLTRFVTKIIPESPGNLDLVLRAWFTNKRAFVILVILALCGSGTMGFHLSGIKEMRRIDSVEVAVAITLVVTDSVTRQRNPAKTIALANNANAHSAAAVRP